MWYVMKKCIVISLKCAHPRESSSPRCPSGQAAPGSHSGWRLHTMTRVSRMIWGTVRRSVGTPLVSGVPG